jgi:hypothetical protein
VSAPQRNPALSNEWLRKRSHRLGQNHQIRQRLEAIIALQKEVWQGQDFSHELRGLACLAVSPHQGRPALLERYWASKTGKTWKALKGFPKRLEGMAEEMGRINTGDRLFFARRRRNDLDRGDLEKLGWICRQLPEMMRSYATALRERNAAVEAVTPRDGRFVALLNLSEVVKSLLGAYHDKDVAELLNTADLVLNPGDPKSGERFDAQTLRDSRCRQKYKTPRT